MNKGGGHCQCWEWRPGRSLGRIAKASVGSGGPAGCWILRVMAQAIVVTPEGVRGAGAEHLQGHTHSQAHLQHCRHAMA